MTEVADRQRRLGEVYVFIQGTTVYHARREEYKECAVAQAWWNYNKTKPTATKQTEQSTTKQETYNKAKR